MSQQESQLDFSRLFIGTATPLEPEEYLPQRSRRDDPLSSKRAESEVKRNGVMRGQRVIAMQLVEENPGSTSKELAEIGTLDRYQLARRLPELVKLGLARTTQTGNEDLRWWPKPIGD